MGQATAGRIVGFAILGIGVILGIVGVTTKEWITIAPEYPIGFVFYTLFEACFRGVCIDSSDKEIDNNPFTAAEYKAALACILMGLSMAGISCIFSLALLLLKISHRAPEITALLLSIIGAPLMIAGTIIYVVHLVNQSGHLQYIEFHYSFYVVLVGSVLILIGGITSYVTTRRSHAEAGEVVSPGQPNIVVQNQNRMQTTSFYDQQYQQPHPSTVAYKY